jgi:DNA-binding response OmpR family regulator
MQAYEEKYFKILIVDENVQFRNTLASRLRLQGFNVEFATGGFHLLHILEKHRDCSLVIMHEDMLDMSAVEIISLVRTTKNKTDLPILFISHDHKEEEICEMILSGANEYIVKSENFQPIVDRAKKYFTLLKNS